MKSMHLLKRYFYHPLYVFRLCYRHLKQEGEHTQPAQAATLSAKSCGQWVLLQALGAPLKIGLSPVRHDISLYSNVSCTHYF